MELGRCAGKLGGGLQLWLTQGARSRVASLAVGRALKPRLRISARSQRRAMSVTGTKRTALDVG